MKETLLSSKQAPVTFFLFKFYEIFQAQLLCKTRWNGYFGVQQKVLN